MLINLFLFVLIIIGQITNEHKNVIIIKDWYK